MFIDLVSQQNYININKKVIKLFGRDPAIYWAELMVVCAQVFKKKKFDENGYFKLDRKYMEAETMLTVDEQLECESVLQKADVLDRSDVDTDLICVRVNNMISLITTEDLDVIRNVSKYKKVSKAAKGDAKREGMKSRFKHCVDELETDVDLCAAYCNWVESIIDNKKPLSKPVLQTFIADVQKYSLDKTKQIELINMATLKAYVKAEWAIKCLSGGYSAPATRINRPQKIATEVADGIAF